MLAENVILVLDSGTPCWFRTVLEHWLVVEAQNFRCIEVAFLDE